MSLYGKPSGGSSSLTKEAMIAAAIVVAVVAVVVAVVTVGVGAIALKVTLLIAGLQI